MTKTIKLNHFSLDKATYEQRLSGGFYKAAYPDLDYEDVPSQDYDTLMDCLRRVNPDLQWDKQSKMHDRKKVEAKLSDPQTRLVYLLDQGKEVGFSLIKKPSENIQSRFFEAANDNQGGTIELDYLAMFDGEEGQGRGKAFFELLFADLFQTYDRIYWSQHSTNAPTLERFYREKIGMEHLAQDDIPDFRDVAP